MTPLKPRDEFTDAVIGSIRGLLWAVELRSPELVTNELARLMDAVMKYHATIGERLGDEPLRRAIERLGAA